MDEKLWSNNPAERLQAARALDDVALKQIQNELGKNCPVATWPWGCPTTINPMIITLGVSPGDSPSKMGSRPFIPMPTAGEINKLHDFYYYKDSKNYWGKIRNLAMTILAQAGITNETDAMPLFGNLNLDTNQHGSASDVDVKPEFAKWMLLNIRDNLRPRIVICLGVQDYLKTNKKIGEKFSQIFDGININSPQQTKPFEHYTEKSFKFREWDIESKTGNKIKLVFWPQHPSRSPMVNREIWDASCSEFAQRHSNIFN